MTDSTAPRIYVASLSDYNAGILHGKWIDATQDVEDIEADVQRMLATSPEANSVCYYCGRPPTHHDPSGPEYHAFLGSAAEEWAIHDYEGFGPIKLSEYESFENVSGWAQNIEEYGPAFAAYVDHQGEEWATPEDFTEAYQGEYDSQKDFAYQLADDICIFEGLSDDHTAVTYFDWDYWTRDLFMSDYYSIDTGAPSYGVYVFRNV